MVSVCCRSAFSSPSVNTRVGLVLFLVKTLELARQTVDRLGVFFCSGSQSQRSQSRRDPTPTTDKIAFVSHRDDKKKNSGIIKQATNETRKPKANPPLAPTKTNVLNSQQTLPSKQANKQASCRLQPSTKNRARNTMKNPRLSLKLFQTPTAALPRGNLPFQPVIPAFIAANAVRYVYTNYY